jgi:hypothetical protein
MKVLAIVQLDEQADLSEVRRSLKEELREAWALFSEDVIREAYLTDDPASVVFVLEAVDRVAAEAQLQKLPLVRLGCFTPKLIELRPFANWANLFAP